MTADEAMLLGRLAGVRERIAAAARDAGRDPAAVHLVVVTKFQPVETVHALAAAGVQDFGESRWPEVRDKADEVPGVRWHFVGQVQTNKARPIARTVDAIHSLDRTELVDALAAGDARPPVLVQVALEPGRPSRGGAAADDVSRIVERALEAGLPVAGVMVVPPQRMPPERAFALIAEVSARVLEQAPEADWISAGMSDDFEAAVRAGATHLRIGRAIVGSRPTAK